jgi:hypothetical protein
VVSAICGTGLLTLAAVGGAVSGPAAMAAAVRPAAVTAAGAGKVTYLVHESVHEFEHYSKS